MGPNFFAQTIRNGNSPENLIRDFSSESNFHREGMLIAVLQRPALGYKLKAIDSAVAKAMPGIVNVVTIGNSVAVVGKTNWQVKNAKEALKIEWERDTDQESVLRQKYRYIGTVDRPQRPGRGKVGEVIAVLGRAAKVIEAEYQCPLPSDNPLDTTNFFAHVKTDSVELIGPGRGSKAIRTQVAKLLGLRPQKVSMEPTDGYGYLDPGLTTDYAVEAVCVSKAVNAPVKVLWTHEDDLTSDVNCSSVRCRFQATLDAQNNLISYQLMVVDMNDSVAAQEDNILLAIADEFFIDNIDYKFSIPSVRWRAQIINFLTVAEQAFLDKVSYVAGNDTGQLRLQLLDRADQKLNEEVTYNVDRMAREGPNRVQKDTLEWCKDAAKDFLYQYATVSALQAGLYDGNVTLGELKKRGDFGLGTFNGVDGELVVNQGKFYRIHSSGTVSEVSDYDHTSLAFVKFFRVDLSFTIQSAGITLEQLQKRIMSLLTVDKLYAIRISGTFTKLTARASALAQRPYQPLKEHLAQNQVIFNLTNTTGVAVGFLVPTSMEKVNIPGFHFHYISDDLKSGGHIFDFTANQLTVEIDKTKGCYLELNTIPIPEK